MDLYLYSYNNYYNRIVKKEDSLSGYGTPLLAELDVQGFAIGDGVATSHVFNVVPYSSIPTTPDYMVAVKDNAIHSRWFVLEYEYTREGQYKVTLFRDVVADSYEDVLDAPAFIEKATLNPDNPLIFNDEMMSFNRIKKSEELLADASQCPWVVAYVPKDEAISFSISTNVTPDIYDSTGWEFHDFLNGTVFKGYPHVTTYKIDVSPWTGSDGKRITIANKGLWNIESKEIRYKRARTVAHDITQINQIADKMVPLVNSWDPIALAEYFNTKTQAETDRFRSLNGKTILKDGALYRIKINSHAVIIPERQASIGSTLDDLLHTTTDAMSELEFVANAEETGLFFTYTYRQLTIELNQLSAEIGNVTIPTNRVHTTDTPYDILTWPAGHFGIRHRGEWEMHTYWTSKEYAIRMAAAMDRELATEKLYDLQILPYCPIEGKVVLDTAGPYFEYGSFATNECFEVLDEDEIPLAAVYTVPQSTFTTYLNRTIDVNNTKISNSCDMYRICSPNYNGIYEFSAAKNRGVNGFKVDCAYKPYTPYVHVVPQFNENGLYGGDYNDARGLICAGDFSLPRTRNAWQEYELNNKNFASIFNRDIKNLEVNNSLAMEEAKISGTIGAIQGGMTGAIGGSKVGGAYGAIIGGAVGFAASAFGAGTDIRLLREQQAETLDYRKDLYGYQLGNIKAIPDSIINVGVLNPNNKLIPVLEFYTCTDTEKQALENKLKYNGMTVMAIGTIRDYLQDDLSYVKAKLIRTDIQEDYHYILTLSEEINKGVFIK